MLKGLSLFANVGIAEAYLESIGVNILVANEIDENRSKFYQHVYPKTNMIVGDITNETIRTTVINEAKEKEIDFIIATPPCQGMSIAGKMKDFDERNQLIYYAIDVIKRVKPKFVLLENVPMQLRTKIKVGEKILLIPEYIKSELSGLYNFNNETLVKAMDYGVPQMRQRNIFLLCRKDTKMHWEFPEKKKIITLKEALKEVPSLDPRLREGEELTLKKFPSYLNKKEEGEKISKWHFPPTHSWRMVEWMTHTPSGCTAFDNEIYYPQKSGGVRIKGHYNHYRRLDWNKPSRTITQNNGVISSLACVHPGHLISDDGTEEGRIYSDPRVFSIYELMIVTSLPLNWNIPEWAKESFIRKVIGEGIPSLLVKEIVLELVKKLRD
ncbi:MAG: DNA cytosine methyltransferase [Tepidibacter sp.]|jgi:DNA (cytosine-5)-methyltransferase 1|uniref:DNA cytosine methyltransferase n=1 Tax=Tepidibacter sp. TaxID=2529387 RepID=UPI0025DE84CD|nr:DNA cytosine methyltransferase [Tepidibacter sp.]MCT4510005.1 DNA cytosine methyltransferase [Tepidibacter sp.]